MKIEGDFVFEVYIHDDVFNSIKRICSINENEVFGYLVGELFKWKEKEYIIINEFLYIEGSSMGSEFMVMEQGGKGVAHDDREGEEGVSFNFMEYSTEFDKLKAELNNERLLRLGWWHSHPGFTCFLSATDLDTQHSIFNEPYHVALVVDPINEDEKFFTLETTNKKGYKEISFAVIEDNKG